MTTPVRCRVGIKFSDTLLTRCRLKIGHNGPHTAKSLRKFMYQRSHWFKGDGREFYTDRDEEYAWSEKSKPTSTSA